MYKVLVGTFDDVKPLWDKFLWPGRNSKRINNWIWNLTESLPSEGRLNENISEVTFHIVKIDDRVIGTNSVYFSNVHNKKVYYRSRGLWVASEFRNKGIAQLLLKSSIKTAIKNDADIIWTCPRNTSINTYNSVGFVDREVTFKNNYGINTVSFKLLKQ